MKRLLVSLILVALLAVANVYRSATANPVSPAPALPEIKSIKILPDQLTIENARDARRFIVMGETSDGLPIDLTDVARVKLDSLVATVGQDGYVRGRSTGTTEITITHAQHQLKLPVTVKSAAMPPVGFVRDIQPILARVGCNAGTCHGSAKGKEGFKLSLRGYDPDFDYDSLINDLSGRRFNRVEPDQSLMLLKPVGAIPHEGGKVLDRNTEYYEVIRQWIAEGTKHESLSARATKIEVLPQQIYLDRPGMSQQVLVIAHYADGTTRDVTREAVISASNIEVAAVEGNRVSALRRGEGAILIRYEGNYAAQPLICMGDRTGYAWVETPQFNYIDEHVHDKLQKMKILPSDLCTDAEFIRRASLDLTGVPPEPSRVKLFLEDQSPSPIKRERIVDELLASEGFVVHWSNKWADLLQCNSQNLGTKGMWAFRNWITDAVRSNMPYDQFVRSLLLAKGSSYSNPEVNYFRALKEPGKITEDVSQTFLGVRFNCNKCHDHPFERWTQKQYYEFGSYFARVAFKKGLIGDEQIVYDNYAGGELPHPKTAMPVAPSVPFGEAKKVDEETTRREAFVEWLASRDNPMFARAMANRVWSYFFGIGIIEPVDDVRAGNPPSNPALLEALTAEFVTSDFNIRRLMRSIVLSRTYQTSVVANKWNEDDKINFSHAQPRRLSAEQMVDAVAVATGFRARYAGLPEGTRSADIPDAAIPGTDVLELFGRPKRSSACECERTSNFTLSHAINLVNGPMIGDAVADPNNRIVGIVKGEKDNRKVVAYLYLAILNRLPTEQEYTLVDLGEGPARLAAAQDLAWALLNSPSFLFNR